MITARGLISSLLVFALAPVLAACTSAAVPSPGMSTPARTSSATGSSVLPSAALEALESTHSAFLAGVGVGPSGPGIIAGGTPEDRALHRYHQSVDVSVFGFVHGVATRVMIPMWYGPSAQFTIKGVTKSVPLQSAVADKTVQWAGSPGADVTFHFEDGYFVLDRMEVPPSL